VRSVHALLAGSRLQPVLRLREAARKRVLVIDDSTTVREALRRALDHGGYAVDLAADGADGWTAVRTGDYALVVTDVDLPRLSGHDLIARMRAEPRLAATPIVIVSYRDRPAGADRYLAKASLQDDQLLTAVAELIGGPEAGR
jgi:two-component system sensor histidine kinase and response regulator WspE